ncbi:hypothetical protein L208DRAFT_1408012 [Tricholoma matsutake]|nr:hypothetical protein L208DRAFT_1408012 [Tricholoma matsutake 945]
MFDSSHYPPVFDLYSKQPSFGLDFAIHDIVAPSVDSFEYDLDLISQNHDFNAFQLELTQVNSAYNNTAPTQGPGSAITFSSESSSQDTLSCYSEPFSHASPPTSNYSFPLDVEMDFQRIRVDDFTGSQSVIDDPTSFGTLPPTPPRSPPMPLPSIGKNFEKPYVPRTSFSDYSPSPKCRPGSSDYYNHLGYNSGQSTISPSHISNPVSVIPSTARVIEEAKGDPRKKYKCSVCPRGFARAYNLKTHMATHDPNRLKPYTCPHRSCGRSFSRKHDLGRHLISIHRDESEARTATSKVSIGVESGFRTWCDTCGKGYVGKAECNCNDVK